MNLEIAPVLVVLFMIASHQLVGLTNIGTLNKYWYFKKKIEARGWMFPFCTDDVPGCWFFLPLFYQPMIQVLMISSLFSIIP